MRTERLPSMGLSAHGERFGEWRAVRPFLGGALLAGGGMLIALTSIFLGSVSLARANPAAIGLLAASAVFLCGVFALSRPELAGLLGIAGIVSTVVSLVGIPFAAALGVVVSLVGGNLCYAWEPDGTDTEN